jgi:RimJ/RimL family protein N-acetyltransferase
MDRQSVKAATTFALTGSRRPPSVGPRSVEHMLVTIETSRLTLRPLDLNDLDHLAPLHAQESFWRYPYGQGWSRDETFGFLERTVAEYSDSGLAVHAVVVRETEELAGWAGLSVPQFLPEILPAVEVGWRLGMQFRRRGYATEAGAAWVRYGFEELDLHEIVSIYEPDNVDSGAVMRRLGFSLKHKTIHPLHGVPLLVMSRSR